MPRVKLDSRIAQLEDTRLLAAMFERAPLGIAIVGTTGRYVRANPAFLRMVGYTEQELLERTIHDFTHPQDKSVNRRVFDDMVAGMCDQIEFEQRYLRKDGRVIWARNTVAAVPGDDGEPRYVVAMVEDITVRRHAEHELQHQQEALLDQRTLLAEAQKLAGLGCWEWDPQSGRVIWSDELYRIYGVSPESFQPSFEAYLERVHPQDRQRVGTTVTRALIERTGFSLQERIVRPDGEVRELRSHGEVRRGADGKALKILAACFDVSEQNRTESALRDAARDLHALTRRLVEAEETERRRIAGELHDRVGQNLSALNINLDIALGLLPKENVEVKMRLADSLALVDGTLQTLEGLMADLRPPLLDEYGLGAALAGYGNAFSQRTGVKVVVDNPDELGHDLRPEAAIALFRIAQEALNNVAKHAQARVVKVLVEMQEGEIVLAVTDDGRGFDPGERLLRSKRWGMTTMRERAAAVGGRIAVQSAPGRGTTVRAMVPREPGGAP
jgi:two-component system, NarL family, sensor histidine kinase UhpB